MTAALLGIVPDVPSAEYHAHESLSASGIRDLLDCPATYRHGRDAGEEFKDAYDVGHVIHELILGKGDGIVVVDAADWRTAAAREAKKQAHAEGKAPVLAGMFAEAQEMARRVLEHPEIGPLFAVGAAEQSVYATDPETGIAIRCRPDWLTQTRDGRPVCVDVKSTATAAHPADLNGRYGVIAKHGYHVSAAHYTHTLDLVGVEDPLFLLLFVSKAGAFEPRAVSLDARSLDRGAEITAEAYRLYADCTERGEWPCPHPAFITGSIDLY